MPRRHYLRTRVRASEKRHTPQYVFSDPELRSMRGEPTMLLIAKWLESKTGTRHDLVSSDLE
jgi:hypothetical protein